MASKPTNKPDVSEREEEFQAADSRRLDVASSRAAHSRSETSGHAEYDFGPEYMTWILSDETTLVRTATVTAAKKLSKNLIRKDKPFYARPVGENAEWEFVIREDNERGGLAGRWSDT